MAQRLGTFSGELGVSQGGGAEAPSGVSGGGLDEQPLERPLAQDAAVGDHVEGHATRHAEVGEPGLLMEPGGLGEQDLLQRGLEAARHVLVEAGDLGFRAPRWLAEQSGRASEYIRRPRTKSK